ncbi:MAG TPA: DedA family protein [Thermodesulfobacteriota bacterium]|nr:DedA family protein [Thermodesulfobacteriota bacterium]
MFDTTALVDQFPYAGIFLLLILGGIGFPFPEDATLILSGFLIAQGILKPLPAFLLVYPGLLITDFFLYWVGKKYGRMVVEHKRFRRLISPDRLSRLEEKFKKRDVWVILVGRHLVGLRAQIFLVAGVMRMSAIKFLITDAATVLLTIALMGGIGYAGGNSIQILKKDLTRAEHVAVVVIVILIAGWFVFKYFKDEKKVQGEKKGGNLES